MFPTSPPLTQIFGDKDRSDHQRIAWKGLREFRALKPDAESRVLHHEDPVHRRRRLDA
jgi:hypothetical protein